MQDRSISGIYESCLFAASSSSTSKLISVTIVQEPQNAQEKSYTQLVHKIM